jgi:hypothetical protein
MIRLYRNVKKCKDGKEYLLDTENDNKPAEFKSKEEIFALFQEEGHMINSIEDFLTEKTFRLLGTLQAVDVEDPQWQKEFGKALMEQYQSIIPFLQEK